MYATILATTPLTSKTTSYPWRESRRWDSPLFYPGTRMVHVWLGVSWDPEGVFSALSLHAPLQIMKTDEDVRMISAEAPVLFAKV